MNSELSLNSVSGGTYEKRNGMKEPDHFGETVSEYIKNKTQSGEITETLRKYTPEFSNWLRK